MMNPMGFLNFFQKKESAGGVRLGIDIGTVSIKIAEIEERGGKTFLTDYAIAELSDRSDSLNNALQSSGLHPLTEELRDFLRAIHSRVRFRTKTARLALPAFIAQTAVIDIAATSKTEKAIAQEVFSVAGNYLPLPATETTFRWADLGVFTGPDGLPHRKILFMAVPTEQVLQYVTVARAAGFTVVDVELENISLARALTTGKDEPILILDIGGRSSTATVAKKGVAYCISQTDFSSDSTTLAVAQALSISPARAESLKRQSAISLGAGSHELSTIVAPIIGAILTEAERTVKKYEEITGEEVKTCVLCGAGSLLTGIEEYVTKELKQTVLRPDALGKLINYPPELQGLLPELNANLSVALGLALSTRVNPLQ